MFRSGTPKQRGRPYMSSETSTTKPPKLSQTSTKPPKRKRKRAVAVKEAEAGRPQPPWLRNHGHMLPPPTAPPTEEILRAPSWAAAVAGQGHGLRHRRRHVPHDLGMDARRARSRASAWSAASPCG